MCQVRLQHSPIVGSAESSNREFCTKRGNEGRLTFQTEAGLPRWKRLAMASKGMEPLVALVPLKNGGVLFRPSTKELRSCLGGEALSRHCRGCQHISAFIPNGSGTGTKRMSPLQRNTECEFERCCQDGIGGVV